MAENLYKILQPTVSLVPITSWNMSTLPNWPLNDKIQVNNNSEIMIDLSLVTYKLLFDSKEVISTNKPIRVDIAWGDDKNDSYIYNIASIYSDTWLIDLQNWLTKIGPHKYALLTEEGGEKNIIVKIYDNANNIFGFKINIEVMSQSIYSLNFEIDIRKAVFNSETASVVFKLDLVGKSSIKSQKIPIVSILN